VALLAEAGVPLETISRRLGHSDGHTTRDVYFHVTKRMEEHDRQLLANVQILQTS
jgi:integrase